MFVSETLNIVLIALGAVLVLAVIAILSVKAVKRKRLAAQQQQQQAVDEGVRKKMLEIRNEYLVLPRNITYSVGPEGEIAVGRYILKSSVEGEKNIQSASERFGTAFFRRYGNHLGIGRYGVRRVQFRSH